MKKGDIVKVKAVAYGRSDRNRRIIVSNKIPEMTGILLGYSFILEGKIEGGYYDFDGDLSGEQAYLVPSKSHKVWVVEPLDKGNRYLEPVRCFEKDIELV